MIEQSDLDILKRPFRRDEHEFIRGFVYLTEQAITDRLDEVDPAWTLEVLSITYSGENVVVLARMTVKAVSRDGVGMQKINEKAGEAEKGAATDAMKRAARLFGVGRYILDAPTEAGFDTWFTKLSDKEPPVQPAHRSAPKRERDNGSSTNPIRNPEQKRVRDWEAIRRAVAMHLSGDEKAQRAHLKNLAMQLGNAGVIGPHLTDEDVILAILADREAQDKAGRGWMNDAATMERVTAALRERHDMSVDQAVGHVGRLANYATADLFLAAVGEKVLDITQSIAF